MKIHDYARKGDIAGVMTELEHGVAIEARDDIQDYSPLMWALVSPEAGVEMVQFLIRVGADVEAINEKQISSSYTSRRSVLHLSVLAGNCEKTAALLDAGLDIHHTAGKAYDALFFAIPAAECLATPEQIEFVQFLFDQGAIITPKKEDYQTALELASELGQFKIAEVLLKNGADASELNWTDLMFAVVFGTLEEVEQLLLKGPDLNTRDEHERSAWHLAIATGEKAKCEILLSYGADLSSPGGEFENSPLFYAIDYGHIDLIKWLLATGVDLDAPNKYQETPLMHAVQEHSVEAVRLLLTAGAERDILNYTHQRAIDQVMCPEILTLFTEAGDDLSDTSPKMRRILLGLDKSKPWSIPKQQRYLLGRHSPEPWTISKEDYQRDKLHRFGQANPEHVNIEFWNAMVRSGNSSDSICVYYDDFNHTERPIWTYSRFGRSITALPDGRYIEIAGENEDFYDPNFCIYNDVFVHYGAGNFDILAYPREVFPPTDFHSATLVGEWIYIVGCTGYVDQRVPGQTPVYRLNTNNYTIEKVETTGNNPGWISEHRAELNGTELMIYWGSVYSLVNGKLTFEDNTETFVLDLETLVWSRVQDE